MKTRRVDLPEHWSNDDTRAFMLAHPEFKFVSGAGYAMPVLLYDWFIFRIDHTFPLLAVIPDSDEAEVEFRLICG